MRTEIEAAQRQKLLDNSVQLTAQAERAVIIDDESYSRGADLQKIIKTVIRNADDLRKEYTGPLNAVIKRINSDFKRMTSGMVDSVDPKVKDSLAMKMNSYVREKERREQEERRRLAREAEERALKEAEALQAVGREAEAEEVVDQGVQVASAVTARHTAPVRGDYGAVASVRRTWTFELEHLADVPLRYIMLNEAAVRNDIRIAVSNFKVEAEQKGLKGDAAEAYVKDQMSSFEIPGIRIFQEVSSVVR